MSLQALLSQPTSRPVVLDGGMGTALREVFGGETSGAVWGSRLLFEAPEVVYDAHKSFLEAGAEILLTNTYQTSVDGFVSVGKAPEEAEQVMRIAVELALRARDDYVQTEAFKESGRTAPLVVLSLGSYGAMLCKGEEYSGRFPEEQKTVLFLTKFHSDRLAVFSPLLSQIDAVAFETIPLAVEIAAIRRTMAGIDMPFWIGMSCPSGKWADETNGGFVVGAASRAIWEGEDGPRPFGVALNCTDTPSLAALIPHLLPSASSSTIQPTLILYPNHNCHDLHTADYWDAFPDARELSSSEWADELLAVAHDAAKSDGGHRWARRMIIGGCCGTAGEEIKALRRGVDASE